MKYVLPISVILALSIAAYGQQPGMGPQACQTTGAGTQVMVKLQVFEVSLTKLRRLGFDWTKLSDGSNAKSNIDQTSGNASPFSVINDGTAVQQILETLRKDDLVKVLAEPTLVTTSGKTAVFHAGSDLSVPKPQPDGSIAIEHQHGTEVEVTPVVLGDKVQLAFHGRLSKLDNGHTVRVGKETVPGVRATEFSCPRAELKSGQTVVIGGLTEIRTETENRGLPYISEIPYLGAIFRKVIETRNELEILILVRPEIMQSPATTVHPTAGSQVNPSAPQAMRSFDGPGIAYPPTVRRAAEGDIRR